MEPGSIHHPVDRCFRAARFHRTQNQPTWTLRVRRSASIRCLPPNRLEYLVTLAMNTTDCNPALANSGIRGDISGGQAFLTAQPFSLIDPVLPFGYGFALVEDSGVVLFHVDKTRNLRENFLQESDWNKQLSAAAFGHSTQGALHIKYLGKDYRARVVPISGLSQAPWSLIVYRDLTPVRTLDLQSITMASTLLLFFLAVPFVIVAVCGLIYRPRFAPEFVWPNRARVSTYGYQIALYSVVDRCFPVSGFPRFGGGKCDRVRGGSLHRSALDVLVFPVVSGAGTGSPAARGWAALPRGLVGIDRHRLPGRPRRAVALFEASHALVGRCRNRGSSSASPAALVYRADVQALVPCQPCRHGKSLRHPKPPPSYRACYVLSILMLVLLTGVLTPMALFRASLGVERRLQVKRAQLHLASALEQHQREIDDQHQKGDRSDSAYREFFRDTAEWQKMGFIPLYTPDGIPSIQDHSSAPGTEVYSSWFRRLIYSLHHDYNDAAAEMLGVISDRGGSDPPTGLDLARPGVRHHPCLARGSSSSPQSKR